MILHIGLHKTGTTSLHVALKQLGYRSTHNNEILKHKIITRLPEFDPLWEVPFDAIVDNNGVNQHFTEIYKWYPEAKYINTVRDIEGWLESRKAHVEGNRANPNYEGGFLDINHQAWCKQWYDHQQKVRDFAKTADVLTLDIPGGDGWGQLCEFLDKPIPNKPFPHKRKT